MNQDTAITLSGSVEVDIFSGLPNPVWIMNSDQVTTFMNKLKTCMPTAPTEMFDGLGYRGFLVTVANPTGASKQFTAAIHNGIVKLTSNGADQPSYFIDTDRSIERWLLDESRTHLDSELQSMIEESWN